jgi:hypothetical protein
MAKKEWKKEASQAQEMTAEQARAYRSSLYKPTEAAALTEEEKRDKFRLHWAQEKYKYGKSKDLEEILWLHLKATKHDAPEKFEDGIAHFGLKKIR